MLLVGIYLVGVYKKVICPVLTIILSDKSLTLLQTVLPTSANRPRRIAQVDFLDLISRLDSVKADDKSSRIVFESLFSSLIYDVNQTLFPNQDNLAPVEDAAPWYRKAQFILLASAGTLIAVCDGFNGIASILVLIPAISPAVMMSAGLVFSALSLAVFYGFDLAVISTNLGVNFQSSPDLLHVLSEQITHIKQTRKKIAAHYHQEGSIEKLETMQAMLKMVLARYHALDAFREVYANSLNNQFLKAAKFTVALMTGVLFFSGGFFTGQSMAQALVSMAFGPVSAAATSVLIVSVLAGLAAFSLYWNLERLGLENFVGQWFGLDKEQIEAFVDEGEVAKQTEKIVLTLDKVTVHARLLKNNNMPDSPQSKGAAVATRADKHYSHQAGFFALKRSHSEGDLRARHHCDMSLLGAGLT